MSVFDTARDIRLPGVVVRDVFLDPAQLSPRMKNMVKAMLRSGVLAGGWSSKSKQLTKKIIEGTDILVVDTNSRGLYIPARGTYSDDIAEQVCALIDADEALELMDDHQKYRGVPHLPKMLESTRAQHAGSRDRVRTQTAHRWCWMFSVELNHQVAELFLLARTPAQHEAAEKLCAMLDNNTHIPITLTM